MWHNLCVRSFSSITLYASKKFPSSHTMAALAHLIVALLLFTGGTLTSGHSCQQWDYHFSYLLDAAGCRPIFLACKDDQEKPGACPSGCQFLDSAKYNFDKIRCVADADCEIGYKCCSDDCIPFKICRPAFYECEE